MDRPVDQCLDGEFEKEEQPWRSFDGIRSVSSLTLQDRSNRLFGDVYRAADDDVMRRGAWAPPVDIYDWRATSW